MTSKHISVERMKEETVKAIEMVGKVLILVPLLASLVLLLYFNITGSSAEIGCGFCLGTVILAGIVLVGYSVVRSR